MDIPEVNRLVNAFCAGAKEVNPDVKCKVTFIGSFFDPPKAKEAALAQIDAGVDVIYAERFGVIEAAEEKRIIAFSNMSDQSIARARHGDHRPGLGHVADGPGGDQAGQGRRLHGAGFRRFSLMAKGGSTLAPLHDWETSCRPTSRMLVKDEARTIMDGNFRVDVDETTPVSD